MEFWDFHAGNLFVVDGGVIGLVDGMVGRWTTTSVSHSFAMSPVLCLATFVRKC